MPASIPRCEILLPSRPTGLVVRHRVDGASCAAASGSAAVAFETLVFFPDRVCALEGGGGLSPWRLGPQLRLTDGATRASHLVCDSTPCATYCAATGCVYFVEGYAILRLDGANVVTPVAGCSTECDQVDAVGRDARFGCIRAMTADGRGNLYVAESHCIRRVVVRQPPALTTEPAGHDADEPPARAASAAGAAVVGAAAAAASNGRHTHGAAAARAAGSRPAAAAAAVAAARTPVYGTVTTLPGTAPPRDRWFALAYDPAAPAAPPMPGGAAAAPARWYGDGSGYSYGYGYGYGYGCLLAATDTAVYRVAVGDDDASNDLAAAAAAAAAAGDGDGGGGGGGGHGGAVGGGAGSAAAAALAGMRAVAAAAAAAAAGRPQPQPPQALPGRGERGDLRVEVANRANAPAGAANANANNAAGGGGGAGAGGGAAGGSGGGGGGEQSALQLLAGDPNYRGRQDGVGPVARFYAISALLAAPPAAGSSGRGAAAGTSIFNNPLFPYCSHCGGSGGAGGGGGGWASGGCGFLVGGGGGAADILSLIRSGGGAASVAAAAFGADGAAAGAAGGGGGGGGVLVVDSAALREVDERGGVVTLLSELGDAVPDEASCMAVLPQGCVAVCGSQYLPIKLVILGGGFAPAGGLPLMPATAAHAAATAASAATADAVLGPFGIGRGPWDAATARRLRATAASGGGAAAAGGGGGGGLVGSTRWAQLLGAPEGAGSAWSEAAGGGEDVDYDVKHAAGSGSGGGGGGSVGSGGGGGGGGGAASGSASGGGGGAASSVGRVANQSWDEEMVLIDEEEQPVEEEEWESDSGSEEPTGGEAMAAAVVTAGPAPPPSAAALISATVVAVRVGGVEGAEGGAAVAPGRVFVAHRAVLCAHSDYFRQLLTGGFAETAQPPATPHGDSRTARLRGCAGDDIGAFTKRAPAPAAAAATGHAPPLLPPLLRLPEADADAFAALLGFMYSGRLEVAPHLLRSAAELAGRLLLPAACSLELQRRLLLLATPATAAADLLWSERHSLGALTEGLKLYIVRHRRQVAAAAAVTDGAAAALAALAAGAPELTAEVMLALMRATSH